MFSHRRGNGLFSSCRSSSHTCPMVLTFAPVFGRGPLVIQRLSRNMAMMPPTTGMTMNQFQNALVKSATPLLPGRTSRHEVLFFQWQTRGLVERALAPRTVSPKDDADEQDQHQHRPD